MPLSTSTLFADRTMLWSIFIALVAMALFCDACLFFYHFFCDAKLYITVKGY